MGKRNDDMLRTGVDLIEIERVRAAVEQHGERFLSRVYTKAEVRCCGKRIESLAARFAAKEAVAKALGTGVWRSGVAWTDIEVLKDESGAPRLTLHGGAAAIAETLGIVEWSISLSHGRSQAIALVVAI
jgi:holo-[acyl-carrier protein] synthase